MKSQQIISELKKHKNPKNIEGMARFGINPKNTLGISIPFIRKLAKKIGKNHELGLELWKSEIHEARILCSMIDLPEKVTEKQMDSWVNDFDSWDVCDQCCMTLFDKVKFLDKKITEYSKSKKEFVKRTAFSLIAYSSVHNKHIPDKEFLKYFRLIKENATDERNFVRKAVNWALRQIGKRSKFLNKEAIRTAEQILKINNKTARWIASDALNELKNEKIKKRVK